MCTVKYQLEFMDHLSFGLAVTGASLSGNTILSGCDPSFEKSLMFDGQKWMKDQCQTEPESLKLEWNELGFVDCYMLTGPHRLK